MAIRRPHERARCPFPYERRPLRPRGQTPCRRGQTPFSRGQALIELAVGLFTLVLVVSALCGFAVYIARSLTAQNELRTTAGGTNSRSDSVDVGDFSSRYVFGADVLNIRERIEMPERTILK